MAKHKQQGQGSTALAEPSVLAVGSQQPTAYETAISRLCTETGCTSAEAVAAIAWLAGLVKLARKDAYNVVFPTRRQMAGRSYQIVDQVMQHDAVAAPGSAHEELQNALLDPAAGELSITHGLANEFGEMAKPGKRLYCTVRVGVGVFG